MLRRGNPAMHESRSLQRRFPVCRVPFEALIVCQKSLMYLKPSECLNLIRVFLVPNDILVDISINNNQRRRNTSINIVNRKFIISIITSPQLVCTIFRKKMRKNINYSFNHLKSELVLKPKKVPLPLTIDMRGCSLET